MTEYRMKTSVEEADHIVSGDKCFFFRNSKYRFGKGDRVTFTPYKEGKPTRHAIENRVYEVTYVTGEEPVEHGWTLVGIRKVK